MKSTRRSRRAILTLALGLTLGLIRASSAQAPKLPEQTISLAEARMIIDGAIAHAREKNLRLGVVVLDASGDMVVGEHMDGAPGRNIMFAEGKAYASVMQSNDFGDFVETLQDPARSLLRYPEHVRQQSVSGGRRPATGG